MSTIALAGEGEAAAETKLCVFNLARESFLSLGVTAADRHLSRLRGLLGRKPLHGDEGIWVVPCNGIHTMGMLFPIDLISLDGENRVIHLREHFGPFRIARPRAQCRSVLELPVRTIYSSSTKVGDRLLICTPEEMRNYLNEHQTRAPAPDSSPASRKHFRERRKGPRIREPGLVVYFWDGAVPKPHHVRDVSNCGAYIETSHNWYAGTLIDMVFQYEGAEIGGVSFEVHSRVMRPAPDGVGVEFLHRSKAKQREFETFARNGEPGRAERQGFLYGLVLIDNTVNFAIIL